jgi:hypothetical protein
MRREDTDPVKNHNPAHTTDAIRIAAAHASGAHVVADGSPALESGFRVAAGADGRRVLRVTVKSDRIQWRRAGILFG